MPASSGAQRETSSECWRGMPHEREPTPSSQPTSRQIVTRSIGANLRSLALTMALAFLVTSVGVGYWTLAAGDELSRDPFNPRLVAAIRDRPRGRIVDAAGGVLAESVKTADGYVRHYSDRTLSQVVGYASFKYGASGIEAAYADSLIGQDAADPLSTWRARYLGEREEPGSVVLGIDPKVQKAAVDALAGRRGAVIALDPRSGAVLASVSLPNFDANPVVTPYTTAFRLTMSSTTARVRSIRARALGDRPTRSRSTATA